jgi:predicted nuclease of predicted toxin-antitoxin system
LRVVCDANIGSRIAKALTLANHDVVRSIHALGQQASDEDVLAYAAVEDRLLISCDSVFGRLIFLERLPPPKALIYVQFEPQNVEDIVPRILPILERGDIDGKMIVIGDSSDRMTAFPGRGNL